MKKILLFLAFALSFMATIDAQKISRQLPVSYSTRVPANVPRVTDSHLWFNTNTSDLYGFDRATSEWAVVSKKAAYGEMSISNDTATLSFTASNAMALDELTTGLMSDFTFTTDSTMTYGGAAAGTFRLEYSASFSFAEAAVMTGYLQIGSTPVLRSRFRQTVTTTSAERLNVAGSCIVTLTPGDVIKFMFKSTHTGTDVLTVYEFNLNAEQIN